MELPITQGDAALSPMASARVTASPAAAMAAKIMPATGMRSMAFSSASSLKINATTSTQKRFVAGFMRIFGSIDIRALQMTLQTF